MLRQLQLYLCSVKDFLNYRLIVGRLLLAAMATPLLMALLAFRWLSNFWGVSLFGLAVWEKVPLVVHGIWHCIFQLDSAQLELYGTHNRRRLQT